MYNESSYNLSYLNNNEDEFANLKPVFSVKFCLEQYHSVQSEMIDFPLYQGMEQMQNEFKLRNISTYYRYEIASSNCFFPIRKDMDCYLLNKIALSMQKNQIYSMEDLCKFIGIDYSDIELKEKQFKELVLNKYLKQEKITYLNYEDAYIKESVR